MQPIDHKRQLSHRVHLPNKLQRTYHTELVEQNEDIQESNNDISTEEYNNTIDKEDENYDQNLAEYADEHDSHNTDNNEYLDDVYFLG